MNSSPQNADRLTAPQVGTYLRISLSTVHHLTRTGKLKAEKQGKRWIYLKSDIEKFINEKFSDWTYLLENGVTNERRAYPRRSCYLKGTMSVNAMTKESSAACTGYILNLSERGLLFEIEKDVQLLRESVLKHLPSRARFQISSEGGASLSFDGMIIRQEGLEGNRLGVLLEAVPQELLQVASKEEGSF